MGALSPGITNFGLSTKAMANDEHLALLRKGAVTWNEWRQHNPATTPELRQAELVNIDLDEVNLSGANLSGANLAWADLLLANLHEADLTNANLTAAKLIQADLQGTKLQNADLSNAHLGDVNLAKANLSGASLEFTNLTGANLRGANLTGVYFLGAILADVDLRDTIGLDTCTHDGPSTVDFRTLHKSGDVPISFWRGCGLPDKLISTLPSLLVDAIQFHSCFISYSANDQGFATRLHADLQNSGVRCWFAPHDLPIGAKTWDAIDEAIRVRDKLLVILSEASIASYWVEDEVSKASAEERSRKEVVLFPIRIDNTVMSTAEPWAIKLRDQRNIGDFRQWEKPTEYQKALERLLRDLKTSGGK
jgi:uncharacterized protein YjbI with pentapeptide repeats